MKKREMVGITVFDGEKFLLLHRVLHWNGWEFPKGGIKEGESFEEAIKRELFEETGISTYELISRIDDFSFYDSVRKNKSHITNFLVRVPNTAKITFSQQEETGEGKLVEHDKAKWFFPKEAIETVSHDNQRETIRKAADKLGIKV